MILSKIFQKFKKYFLAPPLPPPSRKSGYGPSFICLTPLTHAIKFGMSTGMMRI